MLNMKRLCQCSCPIDVPWELLSLSRSTTEHTQLQLLYDDLSSTFESDFVKISFVEGGFENCEEQYGISSNLETKYLSSIVKKNFFVKFFIKERKSF